MLEILLYIYFQFQIIEKQRNIGISIISNSDVIYVDQKINFSNNIFDQPLMICAAYHADGSHCIWKDGKWHNTLNNTKDIKFLEKEQKGKYNGKRK